MTHKSIAEARTEFAEMMNRVAYGKERHTITRHGKPIAAVIPVEDLRLLEELEDRMDVKAAREALDESDERIPYEEVRRELGLSE